MTDVAELKRDERRFWSAELHVDERLADNGPRVGGAAIDRGIVLAGSVIVLGAAFGVHSSARVVVAALLAFACSACLSVLALCLVYAGLFRNRQRQGLHDKASGTIVVHVPPDA